MADKVKMEGILERGYGIIAKKVMRDRNLNVVSKAIYAYICSYAGKGKDAFPSQKLLCEDLVISKNTLGKYIKELKDGSYITVVQHKEKGKFTRNLYTINMVLCTESTKISEEDVKSTDRNSKKKIDNSLIGEMKEEIEEKEEWRKGNLNNAPVEIQEILKKYNELELPVFNYRPENYILLKAYRELGTEKLFESLTLMSQSEFVKNNMSINAIFKIENLKKALNGNFKDKKNNKKNEVKKKFVKPVYEDFTGDFIDKILNGTLGTSAHEQELRFPFQ